MGQRAKDAQQQLSLSSGAGLAQIPGSGGSEFSESADCNCSCQTAEASSCGSEVCPRIYFSSPHCHSTSPATWPQLQEFFTASPTQHPGLALMC